MPDQQKYPDVNTKSQKDAPKAEAKQEPPDLKSRLIAAAKAVPLTADLWTDAGRGASEMQRRIIEAMEGVK